MAQNSSNEQLETPRSSFPLPDAFSSELTALFQHVQPSIVQVRTESHGGGTGVVWQKDGRILTNHHVVSHRDAHIEVLFPDGHVQDATVLHSDPQLDLALLKVGGEALTALPIGNSAALRVGEWAFAIGHPWGQRWAMTAGVIGKISDVQFSNGRRSQYIQSDVGLAPGNSRGPLLNAEGELVGINAMLFGGDLAVSIPSNVVSNWLANLPRGRVALGVAIQQVELSASVQETLQPKRATGLLIVGTPGRPEQLHDLLIGDILLAVVGKPVSDGTTLRQLLAKGEAGEAVELTLLRGGQVLTTPIATYLLTD